MVDTSVLAEQLGFDSIWVGEHVVLPRPRTPGSPLDASMPLVDPVVCLSHIAAVTTSIGLGTGILIVPQRNPVVLAKQLASLDVVSRGRLLLGIGVGGLEEEFRAVGAPFQDRGRRTDEYVEAMQALWEQAEPSFAGETVAFDGVDAHPRPVQRPVPVIVGGHSDAALRRAIARGHGWYGFGLEVDSTRALLARLSELRSAVERPSQLGELKITITPPLRSTERAAYADLGVDRLVIVPSHRLDPDGLREWLRTEAHRSNVAAP